MPMVGLWFFPTSFRPLSHDKWPKQAITKPAVEPRDRSRRAAEWWNVPGVWNWTFLLKLYGVVKEIFRMQDG